MAMADWKRIPDDATINKTAAALRSRGIDARVVVAKEEANKLFFKLVPDGAEVMQGNSITLSECGISQQLSKGKYLWLRSMVDSIANEAERTRARRKLMSPAFGTGSVHAITEAGQIVVASSSGSQLGFYVYGAERLILVVGAQKIVKNLEEAMQRIRDYALPLVNEDTHNKYVIERGVAVNKILIIERESTPDRITLILVKEKLGY